MDQLYRKFSSFVNPAVDLIYLTKITLIYFRAKAFVERLTAQPKQVKAQSWQKWFESKNVDQRIDVTEDDVKSVAKTLAPLNFDPDRLYDLYRDLVTTTSGMPIL